MPRLRLQPLRLAVIAMAGALWLTGCSDNDRFAHASELDEPAFRQAQSLAKTGRRQEALASYLKVIDRRGDEAPESHLEAGLLYLQYIGDPLAAIYHFKKYLALRPNSPQSALVRQRIDAAIREFARTLPAQPLPSQFERIDLLAKVDRLQRENEDLKQQLADVKSGREPVVAVPEFTPGVPAENEAIPTVRIRPGSKASPAPVPTIRPAGPTRPSSTAQSSASAPTGAARSHSVKAGDTLYRLAQQYYGDKARWRDIYAANRGTMKSETDLKIGMTLKIP